MGEDWGLLLSISGYEFRGPSINCHRSQQLTECLFCRDRLRNRRTIFARIGPAKIHAARKIAPHSLPAAHVRRKATVHLNLMSALAKRLSHSVINAVLHLHVTSGKGMFP